MTPFHCCLCIVSAPVSVKKPNIPICNLNGTKGPAWNRNSSHIVLIPINGLAAVDGFKTKLEMSAFIETAPATKLLTWQEH